MQHYGEIWKLFSQNTHDKSSSHQVSREKNSIIVLNIKKYL